MVWPIGAHNMQWADEVWRQWVDGPGGSGRERQSGSGQVGGAATGTGLDGCGQMGGATASDGMVA